MCVYPVPCGHDGVGGPADHEGHHVHHGHLQGLHGAHLLVVGPCHSLIITSRIQENIQGIISPEIG